MEKESHRLGNGLPVYKELLSIATMFDRGEYLQLDYHIFNKTYSMDEISYLVSQLDNPHQYFIHRLLLKCPDIHILDNINPHVHELLLKEPSYLKANTK